LTLQSPPNHAADVKPFATFLADVRRASFGMYRDRPDARIRDERAFDAMRAYLLDRYGQAVVVGSSSMGGTVFDCVQSATTLPVESRESESGCPSGSIPTRRITLDELTRFPTLEDWQAKGPGGDSLPL